MTTARLGELVDILGGGTPDRSIPEYWGGAVPWASVKDFKSTEISRTAESITELGVKNSATNVVPTGSIIVPTRMAVGKAAINTVEIAINQDLKALWPNKRVERRYLLHALLANAALLERRATGATVKGITLAVLRDLEIPLPPLDEQRRIAAILDRTDGLRRKRADSLSQVEELREAIFRTRFVEVDAGRWPSVEVGDLSNDIRTGPFGSQLLHSEFVESGVAVLGIDNAVQNEFIWKERRHITEEKYAALRRYTVRPNDLIITIMGTCGRCAIVPDDIPTAINTKHLCCVTLDQTRALPTFVQAAFLLHPDVRRQLGVAAKGAVMPGLNMGIVKSLSLRLPPIARQREFDSEVRALHTLRDQQDRHRSALDALFASLQHRAFAGGLTRADQRVLETA